MVLAFAGSLGMLIVVGLISFWDSSGAFLTLLFNIEVVIVLLVQKSKTLSDYVMIAAISFEHSISKVTSLILLISAI